MDSVNSPQIAVFGGGCFWCTEAVFEELRGIISVIPGYAGGETPDPTYEQVSSGKTGHAEVAKFEFNPKQINFKDLLTVFFGIHDPTTVNRQGADVGTQYRSIILYTNEQQKQQVEEYIEKLKVDGVAVITELKPLEKFYPAEDYHRQYYIHHKDQSYCQIVINPKLEKLRQEFSELLKNKSID